MGKRHGLKVMDNRSWGAWTGLFSLLCLFFIAQNASADEVSARAALVMEGSRGKILYAKNPNTKLPPASTTKVMTAMVALDRLHPETVVTISKNAAETPSVSPHLREGERLKVHDLLYIALMRSVNGAAVALAEASAGSEEGFTRMMNDKVSRLGLENTRFINASGLPGPGEQYTTAYELSLIMKTALRYPIIREIINTRTKDIYTMEGRRLFFKNTNELLWSDAEVLGGKTGYTRAAGHCLVCAGEKEGETLITVLLGESVRSRLWDDTAFLLSRGEDIMAQKSEPMIYFSPVKRPGVVHASYTPQKKVSHKLTGKKADRRARLAKAKKASAKSKALAKIKKKYKKEKAIAKAGKNKKKAVVSVSEKKAKKKPSGKGLSVQNRETEGRS
ncbi:MAG: D-alanyl-D-alanine carboxypeptidase family protein [Thermodesulfovibrionales bacterium]|jgi:D-alanyl-D-alanine carboxypeptidase (penicillin-binding protein 5/6)